MIEVRNLSFAYQREAVLADISLTIKQGEFVGIIGPNGAGKSTLLRLVAGLLPLREGEVLISSRPIKKYSRRQLSQLMAFVPQSFEIAFNFGCLDLVMMGRYPYLSPLSPESDHDRRVVQRAMEETEVWQFRNRTLSDLSGGERQRVVLASALAQEPRILLLDEPTASLDLRHQMHFYEIVTALRRDSGMTVVSVTHDINLAAKFCQRLLVLNHGRVAAFDTPAGILRKDLLEAVYQVDVEVISSPNRRPVLVLK